MAVPVVSGHRLPLGRPDTRTCTCTWTTAAPDSGLWVSGALLPAGPSALQASADLDSWLDLEKKVMLSKYWQASQLAFQIWSSSPKSPAPAEAT